MGLTADWAWSSQAEGILLKNRKSSLWGVGVGGDERWTTTCKNLLRPKPCTKCKQKLKMGHKYKCKTQSHTIPAGNTGENTGDFESGKVFRGPIPHNLFTFKLTNQIFT